MILYQSQKMDMYGDKEQIKYYQKKEYNGIKVGLLLQFDL